MSENSKIEWCDHTFNPWEGCTKVSPGCDNCYAEDRNARFAGGEAVNWGPGAPRRRTTSKNWQKPKLWNDKPFYQCECGWRGHNANTNGTSITDGMPSCPECDSLNLQPARPRVFCASLADVFDNEVDQDWRDDLFRLIEATPNLDWLLLTKRIGNVGNMLPVPFGFDQHYPHVWIGATITSQAEADRDIPKLLATPAAVRFLSMEPLLGPVEIVDFLQHEYPHCTGFEPSKRYEPGYCDRCAGHESDPIHISPQGKVDWVIVGGESGPNARPMHLHWVRSLREQCEAAGVPFLFKQWGEWAPACYPIFLNQKPHELKGLGGVHGLMGRFGKKVAGRLLDGTTHTEFPQNSSLVES